MSRSVLLMLSGLLLGTLCTPGHGYGQDPTDVEIASRAISYLMEKYVQAEMLPPGASAVIDPAVIDGPLAKGEVDSPDRANRIAARTGARVGTLRQYRTCTDDTELAGASSGGRAICRLTADIVFRAGEAVIEGDTARILLKFWWNAPGRREPTPSAAIELTLHKTGAEWHVVNERLRMIS